MQTIGTGGGALRFPFPRRLQRPAREAHREFAFLQRYFTPRTVFMELGASDCELALQAASYVERVYAVDVSGELLENILVPSNLRLVRCGGIHIPVPEASVDVAWSGRFLEQLRTPEQVEHLKSVRRLLAAGGVYLSAIRAPFEEAGFSDVRVYRGRMRIPLAAAHFFAQEPLRFAAR